MVSYSKTYIADASDSRLLPFHQLRDSSLRASNEILAESGLVVSRLCAAGIPVKALLASPEFYEQEFELLAFPLPPTLYCAERNVLKEFIGYRLHQGVVALAERPDDTPLAQLDDRILISNGINNAENIGAMVRSCRAFGVNSFLVDKFSCSPWIRRAIRVSMGFVFGMKIHHSEDLLADLTTLKNLGYRVFAVDNVRHAKEISKVTFPQKSVLILGYERDGIFKEILEASDESVEIPISAEVDSLNVAATSAIVLYEMQKLQLTGQV